MKDLCMYLPPFAPDYSGVCSAMFDLNALVVIHDASGCTGNYTGFDEPRWYGSQKAVYCSGLRRTDVIMGSEEKFVARIRRAAESSRPDFIAMVGSPVPMVIGTDFDGVCSEIEAITGIPSFGFDATGTQYYNEGVARACVKLIDRYTRGTGARTPGRVNILGATPLDITQKNLDDMKSLLAAAGWEVGACFCMGLTLGQVKSAAQSSVNIAVSQAGVLVAEHMRRRYGIPYLAWIPMGKNASDCFMQTLGDPDFDCDMSGLKKADGARVLVIGDAIAANSVKTALLADYGIAAVDVGTLFSPRGNPWAARDIDLACEQDVWDVVNGGAYQTVIADPLICGLLENKEHTKYIPLSQYAVSSSLGARDAKEYIANHFNTNLKKEVFQ